MPILGSSFAELDTSNNVPSAAETYTAVVKTEDKDSRSGLPMTVITYTIQGGDWDGFPISSYHVLKTKDGNMNRMGYMSLKREAEGIIGARANDHDFDTAELNDMLCTIHLKGDSFKDKDSGEDVPSVRIKRVEKA